MTWYHLVILFFRSPGWWCEKVEKKWRGTRHNQPLHHKIRSIRIEGNPLCQKKNERTSLSTICSNLPHQSIKQTVSVSSFRWILSPTWGSTWLLWSLTSLWHEIHHLGTEDIHRSIMIYPYPKSIGNDMDRSKQPFVEAFVQSSLETWHILA
jgi:hypothetical protein